MSRKPSYEELEQRVKNLEASERELIYTNKQLESLVNNSGFGIVSLDKNMRIVGCNEAFEALFLYSQSEMEGKTLDELIVGGDQIEKANAYTKTTLTGKSIQGLGQRRRKDGVLIQVQFSGIPITVDGEVIGAYGVYEDITALKQAEEALRESEEKYRDLVNNTTDLLYRTDMEGKIIFVSPSVHRLSGYTVEEAIGMKMAKKVYASLEERAILLAKLQEDGYVKNFEAQLKRKDGSIWWSSTNAHFLKDPDGNIKGVEGIIRDITLQNETDLFH